MYGFGAELKDNRSSRLAWRIADATPLWAHDRNDLNWGKAVMWYVTA
jgi:hypothetical protein